MNGMHAKVIIIGSGPAGYTAAIYAARAMLEPMLIAGIETGGQLMITTDVENYPGFADAIQGPWLMEQMRAQAEHVGGKKVVVVGGGNSAVEEALYLANIASEVTVVHRRNAFKAEKILQERLFRHPKVKIIWDNVVDEIGGTKGPLSVTHVRLRNVRSGEVSELPVDGVFVAIGHAPASELFQGQLEIKPNGYIWTAPDSTATSVAGVYAAGDVTDDIYRQAVTAAGMGCMAALEAERWLATVEDLREAAE